MSKKNGSQTPPKARKAALTRKSATSSRRRTRMIALEPRMLFDGALGIDLAAGAQAAVATDAGVAKPQAEAAAPASFDAKTAETQKDSDRTLIDGVVAAQTPPHELVFIDSSVPDKEALVAGAREGVTVIMLDGSKDAIEQISSVLAGDKNVSAVHIVSHGGDGFLKLGSEIFNEASLDRYADQISAWRDSMSADADLVLYGCAVAKDSIGETFVGRLAELTGAEVAASKDATGAAAMGGDWTFEYATGEIDATPFLTA